MRRPCRLHHAAGIGGKSTDLAVRRRRPYNIIFHHPFLLSFILSCPLSPVPGQPPGSSRCLPAPVVHKTRPRQPQNPSLPLSAASLSLPGYIPADNGSLRICERAPLLLPG